MITASGSIAPTTTAKASKDQFLQLLVAQVRNQDPLEPVTQDQFIGQLAQFSTLEGIENLNGNFESMLQVSESAARLNELTQGGQLIGRSVVYSTDSGTAEGIVDAVQLRDSGLSVLIGEKSVPVNQIQSIGA